MSTGSGENCQQLPAQSASNPKKNTDKDETSAAQDCRTDDDEDKKTDLQVHSANSWETADLGDSKRNEKFLRLMGAAKKEHHGRFVIGDQAPAQARKKTDGDHLSEELTEQYEHSMEYRLTSGRKGHLGLGFHPEEKEEQKSCTEGGGGGDVGASGDNKAKEHEDVNKTDDEKCQAREERKREGLERSKEGSSENPVEEKKMKFVKSS